MKTLSGFEYGRVGPLTGAEKNLLDQLRVRATSACSRSVGAKHGRVRSSVSCNCRKPPCRSCPSCTAAFWMVGTDRRAVRPRATTRRAQRSRPTWRMPGNAKPPMHTDAHRLNPCPICVHRWLKTRPRRNLRVPVRHEPTLRGVHRRIHPPRTARGLAIAGLDIPRPESSRYSEHSQRVIEAIW